MTASLAKSVLTLARKRRLLRELERDSAHPVEPAELVLPPELEAHDYAVKMTAVVRALNATLVQADNSRREMRQRLRVMDSVMHLRFTCAPLASSSPFMERELRRSPSRPPFSRR